MPSRSLVLGAAGFLGLNLVDALVARGELPRCAHRATTNTLPLRRRELPRLPRVIVDVRDPRSLVAAMGDIDVVYHVAGHYPRDARAPAASLARALTELDAILDAAATARVPRLVYVSSTATVAPSARGPSTEADVYPPGTDLAALGVYHTVKIALERRALAESRLDVPILCPGACIGAWDLRVGTSALIVQTALGADPPHPDGWVNLVDVRDVADLLVVLGTHPSPPRRTLVSALDLRLHDLLTLLAARYGTRPPSPPLTPQAAIALADAEEARVHGTPHRARLAREIVDLVLHAHPIDARLARSLLGRAPRSLDDALDTFDAFARRLHILPAAPAPSSAARL
ncbi:MAG: NAD-dependent epimerase/dehydratase family protein [Deltaproteobacteria bacterium]|nr:NAD-dependent epimerase/dehydratase family protein [Deltaproteobacteria bacterium]